MLLLLIMLDHGCEFKMKQKKEWNALKKQNQRSVVSMRKDHKQYTQFHVIQSKLKVDIEERTFKTGQSYGTIQEPTFLVESCGESTVRIVIQ